MKENVSLEQILEQKQEIDSSLFFVFADDEPAEIDAYQGIVYDYEKDLLNEINNTINTRKFEFPQINEIYFNGFLNIQDAYNFIAGLPEKAKVVVLTDERFTENKAEGREKNGHNLIYHLLGYEVQETEDGIETRESEAYKSQLDKVISMTITSAFMRNHYKEILRIQRPDIKKGKIEVKFVEKDDFANEALEYVLLHRIVVDPLIAYAKDHTISFERDKYKDLAELFENQKDLLLEVFFDTLYLKDHKVTPFHVYRVSRSAETIARLMGYNEETIEKIKWAGYLHDIGKLAVRDDLLKSPEKFGLGEKLEMLEHAMYSMFTLQSMEKNITHKSFKKWFNEVMEIAYSHHEKRTGKGYPRGISNNEITPEMEILICADVYDARRQPREYKSAEPHEEAVKGLYEMVKNNEITSKVVEVIKTKEFEEAYEKIAVEAREMRRQYEKPLREAEERLKETQLYKDFNAALATLESFN